MGDALVELRNVRKVYAAEGLEVTALDDINLSFGRGEYSVIMGQSGSGKSTLLNLLGCLDRVTTGEYLLGGREVSQLDDDALSDIRSREIGFIFQSYNLVPQLNVIENIEVPLYYQDVPEKEARARAEELAERLGLGDRMRHKPAQLSGGQQQRVAIARSLASRPSLILADEPTGNLDSHTGEEILAILDDMSAEGKTIIMVTHDEGIAQRVHRVIRLMDGAVLSDDSNGHRASGKASAQ